MDITYLKLQLQPKYYLYVNIIETMYVPVLINGEFRAFRVLSVNT